MDTVDRYYGKSHHSLHQTQVEKELALREFTGARIALGAALMANARAISNGLVAPCDESAIAALTQDVLEGLRAVHDAGIETSLTVSDALSFHVDGADDNEVSLHTATNHAAIRRRRLLEPITDALPEMVVDPPS